MVLTIDETVASLIACVPSHIAVQPPFERTNESMYDLRPVSVMYCWIGIGLLYGMMYIARLRFTEPPDVVAVAVGVEVDVAVAVARAVVAVAVAVARAVVAVAVARAVVAVAVAVARAVVAVAVARAVVAVAVAVGRVVAVGVAPLVHAP
jgi:hypothetical protein